MVRLAGLRLRERYQDWDLGPFTGRARTTSRSKSHRRHAAWTPSRIIDWAARTGPATAGLVEAILASRPHPEQGYRSALGIIRLAERHGTSRAEAACARALHLRSYSYRSVESILKHSLDRQPLPDAQPALPAHPSHDNVRGARYYT